MPKWIERIPVDSETSDATYVVGISDEGEYGCSCPHWRFRRQPCKHIAKVKAEMTSAEAVVDATVERMTARQKKIATRAPTLKPPLRDFTARPRRMIQLEDD